MDHGPNHEPTPPDTDSSQEAEPSAAHFREAARLAAARVRASMAGRPEDLEQVDEAQEAPTSEHIEEVARTQARAVSNPEAKKAGPKNPGKGGKNAKASSKALTNAHEQAKALLPEIDERLESGARMLRAFEAQIERLERSARNADELQAGLGPIPDPAGFEAAATEFEARFKKAIDQAEAVTGALETARSETAGTSDALASGLETANSVKSLLETTISQLAEEAERRSNDVRTLIGQSEDILGRMTAQVDRAEQVERTIRARLEQSEAMAKRIEELVSDRMTAADETTRQIERASHAALGSVREHVARELAAISTALLQQSGAQPAESNPQATTSTTNVQEPPLIEIESVTPPVPSGAGRISQGSLSIDEHAIKRRADGH